MQEITECRNELQSLKSIVRKIYLLLVSKNKNEYYFFRFYPKVELHDDHLQIFNQLLFNEVFQQ